MNTSCCELDHLVVATDSLEHGAAYITDKLGVEPSGGGKHDAMGTHNRLLKLGREIYVEVIAIDPDTGPTGFPRWFNLDNPAFQAGLKTKPRLVAWVARTDNIDSVAAEIFQQRVQVRAMRRGALQWRFAGTDDGSLPGDGLIPHLIQWEVPDHPARMLPESDCRLIGLEGAHPDPGSVQAVISRLGLENVIAIQAVSTRTPQGLRARIRTPKGIVALD